MVDTTNSSGAGGASAGNANGNTANHNSNKSTGTTSNHNEGGVPFYESQRKHLKELLEKRRKLAEKMQRDEETIEQKENEYLDSTPAGNILTGFDNYTKGTTQAAAAQRRKTGPSDQHRVFSRSSISYNSNAVGGAGGADQSTATTPGSSHAPTPVSSTFGAGTPTGSGAGGGPRTVSVVRDRKKKGLVGDAAGESESDAKEVKKVRTNFGASRK
ncbi:histone acetyltransferase subunit NuA4-domain-containing protein [Coniella lustricola]|uniref:Chromatin modification-related protein EAF6 n=1 Tax=Coniella lustricola TaxID=2025994 RepID=A0A2T2ZV46_9PEZI|nr:histone acetyltransferase subunit NuA4-domain-containing protein [Coniella lustricola]